MPDEEKTFSGSLVLMTSRAHTLYQDLISMECLLFSLVPVSKIAQFDSYATDLYQFLCALVFHYIVMMPCH